MAGAGGEEAAGVKGITVVGGLRRGSARHGDFRSSFLPFLPSFRAKGRTTPAGLLDRLDGGLPQWNPGGVVLTRVDATTWTITLTGKEGVEIEYKYALGSWDFVEKGAACDELGNRPLILSYGADGTQTVNDTVLNWRNVAPCGN